MGRLVGRSVLNVVTGLLVVLCAGALGTWMISRQHSYVLRCCGQPIGTQERYDGGIRVITYVFEFERCVLHARGGMLWGEFSVPSRFVVDGRQWRLYSDARVDPASELPEMWYPPRASLPEGTRRFELSSRREWGWRTWRVAVPLWALAGLAAMLPAARLGGRLRRPRSRGRCEVCGYDLRATPLRCPECGRATVE